MKKLIIGTRGSNLALNQAMDVRKKILFYNPNIDVIVKIIKTEGDIDQKTPIRNIPDKGFYTKEIERSLIDSSIDIAVHSMKDLPLALESEFEIGAVLKRKSPMDVILTNKYSEITDLPDKGIVAVGSLRRSLQLKKIFPLIQTVDIRGNIETRIKKMIDNNWDGLIMAKAAIERLSIKENFHEFKINEMVPAPCQGIVAIEVLKNQSKLRPILKAINDSKTFEISRIERIIAKKLDGGCKIPVGCLVSIEDNAISINAYISNDAGSLFINESVSANIDKYNTESLAEILVTKMVSKGLKNILNQRLNN